MINSGAELEKWEKDGVGFVYMSSFVSPTSIIWAEKGLEGGIEKRLCKAKGSEWIAYERIREYIVVENI
jgi:hypothetical protein